MTSMVLPLPNPTAINFSASLEPFSFRNLAFSPQFPVKSSCSTFSSRFDLALQPNRSVRTRIPVSSGEQGRNPPDTAAEEAREAVMEILQESGASWEDSVEIASNCPKYVEMLVENVRELDEHYLWGSWKNEVVGDEDGGNLGFKKKVYFMAKRKGDDGILPFLESLGLSHSSSMHIAGYLHSERLPDLISKVKYVKDMLFSGSCNEVIIGRNARRMMMQLSIFTDEDIQQTLSFFEKMEARRGGLDMLGVGDVCFPCLIESFPRLLLCSVENHLKPLIEYFELLGIPKGCVKNIFLLYPSITFYGIKKDIEPRMHAIQKALQKPNRVGAEDKDIGGMVLKYPWILSTSMQQNYDEIHHFFEREKVPKSSVDNAVKSWPHLLGCSTDKMKLMVKQFENLGVRNKMLASVISSSPQLLLRKPNEFLEVVFFMEEVGLDDETIGRILCRCPEIFASSIERTLRKKLKILVDFGISSNHLPRVIRKYPELLVSDVDNTLLPRMIYLMERGLSRREVISMVYRFSPLLGYSIEVVLRPKLDFLIDTMQKPLKEVVEYPRYFSYSLEKKIKPRFWVLKSRNVQCSLKEMLGKNDEEFAEEYMGIGRMLILPSVVDSSS